MRIVLILAFLLCAPAAFAQPVVGVVGALAGSASVTMQASARSEPLLTQQQVREGALVTTGANSRLRLDLTDGTTLTLGEQTSIRLVHLTQPGEMRPTRITHLLGFLRALVAPQLGPAGLAIGTNSVIAAVRGTEWIQHATPGETELFVSSGRVALRFPVDVPRSDIKPPAPPTAPSSPSADQALQPNSGRSLTLAPGESVTFLVDGRSRMTAGIRPSPGVPLTPGPMHTDVVRLDAAKIAAFEAATLPP